MEQPAAEQPEVRQDERPTADRAIAPRLPLGLLMRALGEIGIVTVGILIAFALDAWWDDRSMARQEQIHLRALASDFQENVNSLKKLLALEERVATSSQQLLLRARAGQSNAAEPVTPLLKDVFNSARYEPVTGAYDALVNSAGLTLIQDDSLRAALAQFTARVNDQYAESWSNEHYFAFAREFGGRIVLGFHDSTGAAERERLFQELVADPKFQQHLAMRYYGERDLARNYEELLKQAETILAEIRKQIRE